MKVLKNISIKFTHDEIVDLIFEGLRTRGYLSEYEELFGNYSSLEYENDEYVLMIDGEIEEDVEDEDLDNMTIPEVPQPCYAESPCHTCKLDKCFNNCQNCGEDIVENVSPPRRRAWRFDEDEKRTEK